MDEMRKFCGSAVKVAVGGMISVAADGTMSGALVGEGGNVGGTVGSGVALVQAVRKAKRNKRIFFIKCFVGANGRSPLHV